MAIDHRDWYARYAPTSRLRDHWTLRVMDGPRHTIHRQTVRIILDAIERAGGRVVPVPVGVV